MHYRVSGLLVKSENAAKSVAQPSHYVLEWIHELPRVASALDYGCGKFRYTIPLAKRLRSVTAVDSTVQVTRRQVIDGERTTLREFARKCLPNVTVYETQQGGWKRRRYDRILLANVLSTIPVFAERVRILRGLGQLLRSDGQMLTCTQFRNTYFKTFEANPRARSYRDGWLVDMGSGTASFYGILPPEALAKICVRAGLRIVESCGKSESAYVVCVA